MNTVSLFRVQGGTLPNRSRKYLKVDDGRLNTSNIRSIYVGDIEHMLHFLDKRSSNIDEQKGDLEVIQMQVPASFNYIITKYAMPQSNSGGSNRKLKKVDPTMPGNAYQMAEGWSKLLKEVCICASKQPINNKEEKNEFLMNLISVKEKNRNLNSIQVGRVGTLLNDCKVEEEDISFVLKDCEKINKEIINKEIEKESEYALINNSVDEIFNKSTNSGMNMSLFEGQVMKNNRGGIEFGN